MGKLITLDRNGNSIRSPFEVDDSIQQPPGGKWEYYNHSNSSYKVSGASVTTSGYNVIFNELPEDTIAVCVGLLYYNTPATSTYLTSNPYAWEGATSGKYWFISYCIAGEYWLHPAYLFLGAGQRTTIYARSGTVGMYLSYPHFFIRG